ncbi:MAG: PEP-CTERM sorting domain-containing protein [Deltaproteobacteria bacterium]|nr:PEP-CTERM sorting domain-containing protein [Deltaproteobacteria bacterium]
MRISNSKSTLNKLRSILLLSILALLPVSAMATPITYTFASGSVVVRGTLAGQSGTIFEGVSSVNVPLVDVTAVYDSAIGGFGRLESLSLTAADFSVDLNENLVALDTLDVFDTTISSLSGADLNLFGQFALPTSIEAIVTGQYPDGSPFGPVTIQSLGSTGSATGLVSVSGDTMLISIVGVTLATFAQPGAIDTNAPQVQIKADFTLIGQVAHPVPEPTSAMLFAAGLGAAHLAIRRRARAARR